MTSEDGEKLQTQYTYYQMPIVFCPAKDINRMEIGVENDSVIHYATIAGDIYTVVLDRGFVEIPLTTWDDVMDASSFVKTVQKACGMQIYCIEEIAWRRGMSREVYSAWRREKRHTIRRLYFGNCRAKGHLKVNGE